MNYDLYTDTRNGLTRRKSLPPLPPQYKKASTYHSQWTFILFFKLDQADQWEDLLCLSQELQHLHLWALLVVQTYFCGTHLIINVHRVIISGESRKI